MFRGFTISAVLVVAFAVGACGGDDPDGDGGRQPAQTAAPAAGDVERYCALTRELDADGERFFAGLGRDTTPEQFEAAERRFIESSAAKLGELERSAPAEIDADLEKLFAAMRERAGLEAGIEVDEAEASAAERRIRSYEKRHCDA